MLLRDELDLVPWAELRHAYGSAADTPGHLLALLSSDPEERGHAHYSLGASICHQGSIYEASCAAVPFLIRILREGPADGRASILNLFAGLASRDWYADRNVRTLSIRNTFDEKSRMHTQQEWRSASECLAKATEANNLTSDIKAHMLVAEAIPDYIALLTSDDDDTARTALYLLAAFREAGEQVIQPIAELLSSKTGEDIFEADILLGLGALLPNDSPLWRRYIARLAPQSQSHPLIRYTTAVALARYRPTATPPEAVALLIDAVVMPQQLDEMHDLLAGHHESVHLEACQLLSHLSASTAVDALVTALNRGAPRWRVLDTIRVAEALLDAAFFGGWVQGRYWCHTKPYTSVGALEDDGNEVLGSVISAERPYEERTYHHYGSSSKTVFPFEIESRGFDKALAEQLRDHFAREGGDGLTHDQRLALEAVLSCEPLWGIHQDLLEIYGLPRGRASLKALLGKA